MFLENPLHTIAAAPAAAATAAPADGEPLESHWQALLQDLRIGEARIGHVRLHRRGTVEAIPGKGIQPGAKVVMKTPM